MCCAHSVRKNSVQQEHSRLNSHLDVQNLEQGEEAFLAPSALHPSIDGLVRKQMCKKVHMVQNLTTMDGMCHASYSTHYCMGLCASMYAPRQSIEVVSVETTIAAPPSDMTICQYCAPVMTTVKVALKCDTNRAVAKSVRVRVVDSCVCSSCKV